MLRNQPTYLATFISLSHGSFLLLGHGIFMTLLQVILLFCLVKDERQELVEQICATPFQGWVWAKKTQHTLHRAINQQLF